MRNVTIIKYGTSDKSKFDYAGVQSKNSAYHNVNKIKNSFTDALILNLIDIVVYVVFALYSSMAI